MATTPRPDRDGIERREFIKKTGAGMIAAGFPGIISAQTVTNALKVGLVGAGGRGSGAAAQALSADANAELTAVADIDEAIVERASQRLRGSEKFGARVKIDNAFFGLDAYDKVISSGVDVVLLATPPGFRPQHLTAAVNASKHVFCEKPCATDSPGVREVMEAQKLAQTKNLALVSGFCWRYSNMIQEAMQQVHNGALGRLVAHYSTYYTNPVKPMPPESDRPAGMSDVEWQIRNWYNFAWLCGDSLVEQAVHNADKIMWVMNDQPPVSCVAVGGRAVPANGGNIYDHFEVNYLFPNGYRVFLGESPDDRLLQRHADYMMGTDGRWCSASASRASKRPTARSSGSSRASSTTCISASTTCCLQSIRAASRRTTTSIWPPVHCWRSWGECCLLRSADHLGSGDELTGEPGAQAGGLDGEARGAGAGRSRPHAGCVAHNCGFRH